jgi:RND family efflux transporter MFP subunit
MTFKGRNAAFLAVAFFAATPVLAQEGMHDCVIAPNLEVEIGSASSGVVEEVLVSRGDRVVAGQPVARLESEAERAALRIIEARAREDVQIELARNRIDLIEREAKRTQTLASKQLAATNVLEEVMSRLKQAQLELRLAESQRHLALLDQRRTEAELERRIIRSPIDGVVLRRLIGPGEFAHSEAKVARIAKTDPLHVEVFLPTKLYTSVSIGQMARLYPAEPVAGEYEAIIVVVDQVFDAASDTFGVRLTLPNPGGLLPAGLDCRVKFD